MKASFSETPPLAEGIFTEMKRRIDETKSLIDDTDSRHWSKSSRLSNPFEEVSKFDNCVRISRAFYKLLEIERRFKIFLPKQRSVLLAEAPGGFAEAYLWGQRRLSRRGEKTPFWATQSLVKTQCHFSPRIPKQAILYSPEKTGDITDVKVLKFLIDVLSKKKISLVTADGGIDFSNAYTLQEVTMHKLIFSEITIALSILQPGGTFVCKLFDVFTKPTIQFLNILKENFTELHIVKLHTSRPCNSEKYIICKDFLGRFTDQHLERHINVLKTWHGWIQDTGEKINQELFDKLYALNATFVKEQVSALQKAMDNIKIPKHVQKRLQQIQNERSAWLYVTLLNKAVSR